MRYSPFRFAVLGRGLRTAGFEAVAAGLVPLIAFLVGVRTAAALLVALRGAVATLVGLAATVVGLAALFVGLAFVLVDFDAAILVLAGFAARFGAVVAARAACARAAAAPRRGGLAASTAGS